MSTTIINKQIAYKGNSHYLFCFHTHNQSAMCDDEQKSWTCSDLYNYVDNNSFLLEILL